MIGRLFRIRGLVQGVGFRPYVWRLATELGLTGWVRNDGSGVIATVGGKNWPIFKKRLPLEAPRLARIDAIEDEAAEVSGEGFAILASESGEVQTAIGPDAGICPDCVADLFNPANRRWRYAFTTCTHCGPRYTVSRQIPYDRASTSLANFPLCAPCAAEYTAPADRRFHAETTCCPDCGPQLRLLDATGQPLPGDPIAETLRLLRAGQIVAIKGLGGFHLACRADDAAAVAELRRRKARDAKPFAVMALNRASLAGRVVLDEAGWALFESVAAPIVVGPAGPAEWPGVAPGLASLGVMRPATPLHLLLWHEAAGRPSGTAWLTAPSELRLVMTSANPGGEPLVTGNDEALARLGEPAGAIADAFLLHDRDIVVRCDDSLLRPMAGGAVFLRRARGWVPVPIDLGEEGPDLLAVGGYLKTTVCAVKGRQAFLSQHVGSLDNAATRGFLDETVCHLVAILGLRPVAVAHDRHPDFPSTALALQLADQWNVPALAVGHHHAHLAALCAEWQIDDVLGLALDGVGLGDDGGAWGGELMQVAGADCRRLGHLVPLPLPGGDRAAREPWRMAVAALHALGRAGEVADWLSRRYPGRQAGPLLTMLSRNLRCPPTSSLGRWFDAAAGLLGVCGEARYEGQAAMMLEALASTAGPVAPLAEGYVLQDDGAVLDLAPLAARLADETDPVRGAAIFHATLAAGLAAWVVSAVDRKKGPKKVVIGGGCAMNARLMDDLTGRLAGAGLQVFTARQAPPNDGGLALGQAWVARRRLVG